MTLRPWLLGCTGLRVSGAALGTRALIDDHRAPVRRARPGA
jgi:hypothetical protein